MGVDMSDGDMEFRPYAGGRPADVGFGPLAEGPEGAPPRRVVALGATCDVRPPTDDPLRQRFSISEFALLDDGRRVILDHPRGYTLGAPSGGVGDYETIESVTRDVLNAVIPEDDDVDAGEEHPWSWLAELARARGLDITAEDLRELPYEVVLTDDVIRWLGASGPRSTGASPI
jgi:hypothetical protein